MGLFLCQICDEQLSENHECTKEAIIKAIKDLHDRAYNAERKLNIIKNCVFQLVTSKIKIVNDEIVETDIDEEWLSELYKAAQCSWYEKWYTREDFLVVWISLHQILTAAYDLFRGKRPLLDKLIWLKEKCDNSKEIMGYKDSKFTLTPEDIINGN